MSVEQKLEDAMTRSREVLETLKAIKGPQYAAQVHTAATIQDLAQACGMPWEAVESMLTSFMMAIGKDHTKREDQDFAKVLVKDVTAYLDAKEVRS